MASGREACRRHGASLTNRWRLPIIICTAAVDQLEAIAEEIETLPRTRLLKKPFSLAELEAALQDAFAPDHPAVTVSVRRSPPD